MMKALRYTILRDVFSNRRILIDMPEKPLCVAAIVNEGDLLKRYGVMIHRRNVFFEDYADDWKWKHGKFSYFSRTKEVGDVLVVFEVDS